MSVGFRTLYSQDTILSSKENTFTVSGEVDEFNEKINLLCVKGIDLQKKQITLGALSPVENFSVEQCKQLACTHNIVMLQRDPEKKIIFSVSQVYLDKFPTTPIKLVLQKGNKEELLCVVNSVQFLDSAKYKVVVKNFMPFVQLVTKQATAQAAKK